jgi:membrane-bound lytic murein transglycosylase A
MGLNKKHIIYFFVASFFVSIALIFFEDEKEAQIRRNEIILTKTTFSKLPGWQEAEIYTAKRAFIESCRIMQKKDPSDTINFFDFLIDVNAYKSFCIKIEKINNSQKLKNLIESSFHIVKIKEKEKKVLFTGYIELELKGRLEPSFSEAPNAVPIYKKPNNLITVDLGLFKEELKNKKIKGFKEGDKFIPVATRSEIEKQNLFKDNILAYIDDPARAYFLHIQGSGIIKLPSGKNMSVGYDGDNGQDYFSIGRSLIKDGIIPKEKISMQSITKWMQENEEEAISLRHKNKRFIFFKDRKKDGPVGASGLIVTPMHSAAVDKSFLPYHLPLWANVKDFYTEGHSQSYSNLIIAQDTGSAIKGATRIDLFLGKGEAAEMVAGKLNSKGSLWAFIPK